VSNAEKNSCVKQDDFCVARLIDLLLLVKADLAGAHVDEQE
jgi:hypothetical protein